MAKTETSGKSEEAALRAAMAAFQKMDQVCSFGPSFFLGELGRFVRDRCPTPDEGLPEVEVSLADGDVLTVCHIAAVSPRWVVFAVPETSRPSSGEMATEFVPYELIRRVRIRRRDGSETVIGFEQGHRPELVGVTTTH